MQVSSLKEKRWTQREVDGVNFLLRNKEAYRELLETGKKEFVSLSEGVTLPMGLDDVVSSPLWMSQFPQNQAYWVLCALPDGHDFPEHWMCTFEGTLMSSERKLIALFRIEEWINFKFPELKWFDLEKQIKKREKEEK